MPEVGKEQDPGATMDGPELPDGANKPSTIEADSPPKPEGEDPALSAGAPTLAPEVEAAFRKIAKEEIGKALGHTIV